MSHSEPDEVTAQAGLSDSEQALIMRLARRSLEAAVRRLPEPATPEQALTPALRARAGCFVTLMVAGNLRGCIGRPLPDLPLHEAVVASAGDAALHDPRFDRVQPSELPDIRLSVSVLTPPRPAPVSDWRGFLEFVEPLRHGVILRNGRRSALFLPEVWEHFTGEPDPKAAFLGQLSRKAGDRAGDLWREPATRFEVFEALHLEEPEP